MDATANFSLRFAPAELLTIREAGSLAPGVPSGGQQRAAAAGIDGWLVRLIAVAPDPY